MVGVEPVELDIGNVVQPQDQPAVAPGVRPAAGGRIHPFRANAPVREAVVRGHHRQGDVVLGRLIRIGRLLFADLPGALANSASGEAGSSSGPRTRRFGPPAPAARPRLGVRGASVVNAAKPVLSFRMVIDEGYAAASVVSMARRSRHAAVNLLGLLRDAVPAERRIDRGPAIAAHPAAVLVIGQQRAQAPRHRIDRVIHL